MPFRFYTRVFRWTAKNGLLFVVLLSTAVSPAFAFDSSSGSYEIHGGNIESISGNGQTTTTGAGGSDIAANQVSTSSLSAAATQVSQQRKTWYDGTRYWAAFRSDPYIIEFWYSVNGSTWTKNTSATIDSLATFGSDSFSVKADSSSAYLVISESYIDVTTQNRVRVLSAASYPSTSFSWTGTTTIVSNAVQGDTYSSAVINQDTSGYVHVCYTYKNGATYTFNCRKSTNPNNITAWDAASVLNSSTNANKFGDIAALSGGDMYSVYIDGTAISGKKYTAGAWDVSPTSIATGTSGGSNNMSMVSVTSTGEAYLSYIDSSGHTVFQRYNGSWQAAVTLDANAGNTYITLSINTPNNDLYAFWIRSNTIYQKKGVSSYASANWDTNATTLVSTGTNAWLSSAYKDGNNQIAILWTDGTVNPWSIKFFGKTNGTITVPGSFKLTGAGGQLATGQSSITSFIDQSGILYWFYSIFTAVYNQKAVRLENDDGGAGYGGTEITTPYTAKIGERMNLRFQLENTGQARTRTFKVQYDKNSNGTWVDVLPINEIRPALSVSGRDGQRVPIRAAGSCGGGVTFVNGKFYEGRSTSDATTLQKNRCTELVFTIDTKNAVAGTVYRFRLFNVTQNAALTTYTQYPTFTAAASQVNVFSKSRQNTLATSYADLRTLFDKAGYDNAATDDAFREALNNVLGDTTADVSIHNPEATVSDFFGFPVSSAGDVNGDGYADVIVGCYQCDGVGGPAVTDAGDAFIYYGGASMDTTADVSIHNPEATISDHFGVSVSSAGDVNGDGYSDVIVGCEQCDGVGGPAVTDAGDAFVYYGGSSMDATADVSIHSPEATVGDFFGYPVSSAGDVNGDGYSDVIVGCEQCDGVGGPAVTDAGSAFIYYGGSALAAHISTANVSIHNPEATAGDRFGVSVSSAGDVNGDGYGDVVISCYVCDGSGTIDSGSAFTYYSGALMDATNDKGIHNPEPTLSDSFGGFVSSAGDVNGDGYSDVIVGCYLCDGSGTTDSGSAYVYYGGPNMDTIADVSIHNPEPAPVTLSDAFGYAVSSAGDVNGDGYADVIVGCYNCDGSGTTDSGSAYIYYGGSSMNNVVDVSIHNPEATVGDSFGYAVASAGDINGDGFSDVVVGCVLCDGVGGPAITDAGDAFVYYGGSSMNATVDVSIHNPEATLNDNFGRSRFSAGDVNGDGYSDVIVGCYLCDGSGTIDSGSVYVFYGGSSLAAHISTANVSIHNPEPTAGDSFGRNLAPAGDVNGDGYSDVIVGCYLCDGVGGPAITDAGDAFIYYGGSTMNNVVDVSIHNPEATLSDAFGVSVSSAGDVNGDGYSDVVVGCDYCDGSGTTDSGSAFIFYGGPSLAAQDSTADVSIHNPEATLNDAFGHSVASAGDINGDGYGDIIIGCEVCDGSGTTDSGSVYEYMGGKSADYSTFNFSTKAAGNTASITTTWKGQSTIGAATANFKLQVYRFGSTNAWVDNASDLTCAVNTQCTLAGSVTTLQTEYYDGAFITYWRVIQNGAVNPLFQTQYWNILVQSGLPATGDATSVVFDTTSSADGPAYNSILWKGTWHSASDKVRFQLATSASSAGPWNYYGSNDGGVTCNNTLWYDPGGPDVPVAIGCNGAQHNNQRYFRYKAQLCSGSDCSTGGADGPTVQDIVISWSP